MRKHQRRNYFIDKAFQTKFIVLTIALLLTYSLLFVAILFFPYVLPLYGGESLEIQAEAARQVLTLHRSVWPALGIVILAMGVLSIFISHKVAGPVYRIKRTLAQAVAGDLEVRIRLRKRDDLQDLAEHVNLLLEEVGTFVATLRENDRMLAESIGELERQIENRGIDEVSGREIIARFRKSQAGIAATLERFAVE